MDVELAHSFSTHAFWRSVEACVVKGFLNHLALMRDLILEDTAMK